MSGKVPIAVPFLDAAEEEAVVAVLRTGWVSQGPQAAAFERAVAAYMGIAHARAVNSGTSAIHLALLACGVEAGDEVIVPAFTCVAALHPIEAIGARAVPVDIAAEGYGLDPALLERAITGKTRAIMAAHLFGHAADIAAIAAIAQARALRLIEDVALGLGVRVHGRHVGGFGDACVLSFHPRKTITTGEGGMVLSPSQEVIDRVGSMRNYGASVQAWARHNTGLAALPSYETIGFNYKMTDIQAAIGVVQMTKIDAIQAARARIARRYDAGLAGLAWLALPPDQEGVERGHQSYVCRTVATPATPNACERLRVRFLAHLTENGIASVQAAQSMTEIAYYHRRYGWRAADFPNAIMADKSAVALPIFPTLAEADQDRVIAAIRAFKG